MCPVPGPATPPAVVPLGEGPSGDGDASKGDGASVLATAELLCDAVKRLSREEEAECERPTAAFEEGSLEEDLEADASASLEQQPWTVYPNKGALAPYCGLTELALQGAGLGRLPSAVGDLAGLEVLNCGGNPGLCDLPASLRCCTKLRVCFFLGCGFESVPAVLGDLPSLFMLSFKNCKVGSVDLGSLAPTLGWLILTGNRLVDLPDGFGARVPRVRKLMLASNALKSLPLAGMAAHMHELELLRLSDNALTEFPEELFLLPRLAWVALAGNPCVGAASANALRRMEERNFPPKVPARDVEGARDGTVLGTGTSGAVRKGTWKDGAGADGGTSREVAIKLFDENVKTSDGNPRDELVATSAASAAGVPGIVSILGQMHEEDGGKSGQIGLLCTLLEGYKALGGAPSFSSVTRDTYPADFSRSLEALIKGARGLSRTLEALHRHGICHGDVYSHNLLLRGDATLSESPPEAVSKGSPRGAQKGLARANSGKLDESIDEDCRLGDFGAAWFYKEHATFDAEGSEENVTGDAKVPLRRASRLGGEPYCKPYDVAELIERVEVRAFGIWLSEMLAALDPSHGAQAPPPLATPELSFTSSLKKKKQELDEWARWAAGDCAWLHAVADACMSEQVPDRPTFATVVQWIG